MNNDNSGSYDTKFCDFCRKALHNVYYDIKTTNGPWAIVCTAHWRQFGARLGTGLGQRFEYLNGQWEKTHG